MYVMASILIALWLVVRLFVSKYLNILIKNIRRIAPEMSNYELSKLSGVSQSVLGRYESGERSPSLETIVSIANALNVEPYQLLKSEEEKNIPTDILQMLDGQSDTVYDTIRTMLNALNQREKKKAK